MVALLVIVKMVVVVEAAMVVERGVSVVPYLVCVAIRHPHQAQATSLVAAAVWLGGSIPAGEKVPRRPSLSLVFLISHWRRCH